MSPGITGRNVSGDLAGVVVEVSSFPRGNRWGLASGPRTYSVEISSPNEKAYKTKCQTYITYTGV